MTLNRLRSICTSGAALACISTVALASPLLMLSERIPPAERCGAVLTLGGGTPTAGGYTLAVSMASQTDGNCAFDRCPAKDCSAIIQLKVVLDNLMPIDCPEDANGDIDFAAIQADMTGQYADCEFWHGDMASDMCPGWGHVGPSKDPQDGSSEHRYYVSTPCATVASGDSVRDSFSVLSCDGTVVLSTTAVFKCNGDC